MSETATLKGRVAKGLLWGGLNNGTQQLLNLVIGIFLARLLTPADYGMVGVLAVFSAVAASLQEGGFIAALTNRRNPSHLDYCSVFWFTTACGITFYVTLFFLAPLIARFYNMPQLTPLARFMFLGFLFSSVNVAPRALLFRNLQVRRTAIATVSSLALSGLVGVALAYNGYAYWGLAWQTVSYTFFLTLSTFVLARWTPSPVFAWKPVGQMLAFSSKLVVTNVFNVLNNNIFSVLLGKFYTAADVGAFNQANKWNLMGSSFITGMMQGVAQPSMARVADDGRQQVRVFRKLLRFTALVSFPAMLGLCFVAPDFIVIAITERWLFSASLLQVLCIGGAFYPLSHLLSVLVMSQGRSTAYMWSAIALSSLQMLAVYFSYPYGLYCMMWVFVTINIGWTAVWWAIARRRLPLPFLAMVADVAPYMLTAVAAIVLAWIVTAPITGLYLAFVAKIAVTALFYTGILWMAGSVILREAWNYLRRRL